MGAILPLKSIDKSRRASRLRCALRPTCFMIGCFLVTIGLTTTVLVVASVRGGGILPHRALEPLRIRLTRPFRSAKLPFKLDPQIAARTPPLNLQDWAKSSSLHSCVLDMARIAESNPDEAARVAAAARTRCCLRSLRSKVPLGLSKRDLPRLKSVGFSQPFLDTLPVKSVPDHFNGGFGTCAVVSNAPSLRLRKFETDLAREIDNADAVFRLNLAPTKGFEEWVGSKETVRVITLHTDVSEQSVIVDNYLNPGSIVFIRDELYDRLKDVNMSLGWNVPRFSSRGVVDEFMMLRRRYPSAGIYLNHPVFAELSLQYLHTSLVGGNPRSLSSGTQAIFLAMMLCDKVVSYEVASEDILSSQHKYYYETTKRKKYRWWHPFKEESSVLSMLATRRRANTTIYEFDMDSEDECPPKEYIR